MKTIHPVCLSIFLLCGLEHLTAVPTAATGQAGSAAQNLPASTAYAVTKQDGNSRVWERTVYEPGPNGQAVPKIHRYKELATGLNYLKNGQYTASKEEIDVLPQGGAEAIQGQHQVYFPGNINTGVIKVVTPDGKTLQSRPLAIFYDDGSNTVALAVLTNSVGVLVGSNEVVYPDAFSGLKADLRYTYKKGGFEQDIVLEQQPHPPEYYGLDPAKTHLQVLTEFVDTADPVQTVANVDQQDGLSDRTLKFGQMKMVKGKAFAIGNSAPTPSLHGGAAVYKSWQHIAGRTFLVEELPVKTIAAQLQQLPMTARADTSEPGNSILHRVSASRLLPATRLADANTRPVQMAKADLTYKSGVVLDYVSFDYTSGDVLFQGDTTYLVSGEYAIDGTTTVEGGAVVKYYAAGWPYWPSVQVSGPLNCLTSPYRPAVFTSIDDNTVGETISGSTGTPPTWDGSYYSYYIYFDDFGLTYDVHDLRFCYAYTGLGEWATGAAQVRDCQFVQCQYGMDVNSVDEVSFYNVLFAGCSNAVSFDQGGSFTAENMTADVGSLWGADFDAPSSYNFTNCIILGSIDSGITLNTNQVVFNPSGTVFQTVGAGSYYLADGSPYRDIGTTNIDSTLLADLATKTTYPPIVYSGTTFTVATNFSPQALRDNDTPDLGYHYDPLDYVFSGVTANSNITFTAGTAMGWFEPPGSWGAGYGITLPNYVGVTFNGTVTAPCVQARYDVVQEGGNGLWTDKGWLGGIIGAGSDSSAAAASLVTGTFTHFAQLANDPNNVRDYYAALVLQATDSEFWSGGDGGYALSLYATNCLFDRSPFAQDSAETGNGVNIINCTFHGGSLSLTLSSPITVIVENSSFDNAGITTSGYANSSSYATYDYNAYTDSSDPFPFGGSHDVIVSGGFNWQSSWLGNFYLPAGSTLINAGSTTADQLGLYYFTTQVSQIEESNSIVDIGYHYVALGPDTAGLVGYWPLDEGSGTVAHDESGYGDNGTLESSPAWIPGYIGPGALSFDGTSYVTVSDSTPLEVGGSGADFSVSFWFYLKSGYDGNYRNFMRKGNSDSDRTFAMWMNYNDNRIYYRISTTASWDEGGTSASQVPLNQWVHVAYVKSGGQLQLYLNGVLDSQVTLAGTSVNNNGPVYFGKDPWYEGANCDLDDIRIYSRALGAGEVSSLAAGTLAPRDSDGDGIPDYLEGAGGGLPGSAGSLLFGSGGKVSIFEPKTTSDVP